MKISSGVKKLVETNALALASIGPDGRPHNIAVACCRVEGDKIIITNTHIHRTIENIKTRPTVAMVVWLKEWEETCAGFEIIGRAENFPDGQWLEYVKKLPDNEGYDVQSAIVVTVEEVRQLEC